MNKSVTNVDKLHVSTSMRDLPIQFSILTEQPSWGVFDCNILIQRTRHILSKSTVKTETVWAYLVIAKAFDNTTPHLLGDSAK